MSRGSRLYCRGPNQDEGKARQQFLRNAAGMEVRYGGRFRMCLMLPQGLTLNENRTSIENEKCEGEDM